MIDRPPLFPALLLACAVFCQPAHAFKLISENEADLPAATPVPPFRAITRGPGIKQIQPDPSAGLIRSPVTLQVAFEPRGGAKIDPASIRLTYLKSTPIDLSSRAGQGISEKGISLMNAEIPPGEHDIQVSLQDSEGRKAQHVIKLKIAP